MSTATKCRPGGHDCWEQVVAPPPVGAAPSLGPLAILEAFDHLDAVWRARGANHPRLVELKSAYSTGILGLACTNRDEFQRFNGSLADLLDHMKIGDELLSQEATKQSRDGSLQRFKAWAMASLQEDDQAQAIEALKKLQQIRMLRNHFLHSGASSKLPNSLAVLGISYPPDWGQAWEMVTHQTVDALRQLREAISD
ncbi:MAG: hypothetical protein HYZ59_04645 [Actinobacteria bacterium]|nr:hypothetical protein [Actinomycetota bacterium]